MCHHMERLLAWAVTMRVTLCHWAEEFCYLWFILAVITLPNSVGIPTMIMMHDETISYKNGNI